MTSYASSCPQSLTRATRRRLVVANTLGYLGLLGFWTLGNRLELLPLYLLAAACALVFAYSFYKVFVGVHPWNVANADDKVADERQQAVRNRAHTLAYRIVSLIFALALTYWYLVAGVMGDAGFGASLWLPSSYNEISPSTGPSCSSSSSCPRRSSPGTNPTLSLSFKLRV